MKPDENINLPWELCGYIHSYYSGDNKTWKLTTGYIFLINGSVIDWCMLSQKRIKFLLQTLNTQTPWTYVTNYYLSV